jgi:hypothetical protein
MYVHREFLDLILTRQVEDKRGGGWAQENDSNKCMGLFQYIPFTRGSEENADKAQNFY